MWETATKAIDVWSVGCIFAELLNRKAFFPGKNYLHQLDLILDVLGTPSDQEIKGCDKAKTYMKNLPFRPRKDLRVYFPNANPLALDLLSKMLTFDPTKRITVEEALAHSYLENLHDEHDEPTSTSFDFSFETEAEKGDLKNMIYREVMDWNLLNNNIAGDALLLDQSIQNITAPKPN